MSREIESKAATGLMSTRDARQKPPDELRTAFRALQKGLSKSLSIFDFNSLTVKQEDEVLRTQWQPTISLEGMYDDFTDSRSGSCPPAQCCEFKALPGRSRLLKQNQARCLIVR